MADDDTGLPVPITALLLALTIGVQVAAIWAAADPLQAVDAPAPVQTSENEASTAIPFAAIIIGELALFWLVWVVYRRLPAFYQRLVKRGAIGIAGLYAVLYAVAIMPALLIAYTAILLFYVAGYVWLAYDGGALVVAIVLAATLGGYLGPIPLAVLLAGFMIYDYVAVMETSIMDRSVSLLSKTYIPILVVVPTTRSFNIRGFLEALAADGTDLGDWSDRIHTAIGVGDFAIPAAFTVAVFRYYGATPAMFVLVGTLVGMTVLTSEIGSRRSLPGLPYLGAGGVAGFALAVSTLAL